MIDLVAGGVIAIQIAASYPLHEVQRADAELGKRHTRGKIVLIRAAEFFAKNGIPKIQRILSDNAFAYRNSAAFKEAVASLGADQRFIKPHCPWTNGKVERLNRTLATEWAYSPVFTSNDERTAALAPWLNYYNTERIHGGIGATPISRVSPTS